MFRSFFDIKENPFSNTPDPRYIFMSNRHQEALAHLIYGVQVGSGFVLLTGEVGTGKTTTSRCLIEKLPDTVDLALCVNPSLNETELLASICDEMGIAYPHPANSTKILMDTINKHLLETHARGRSAILIIDEAQNLSPQVLELVRMLTNLETTSAKLLQIILIGQPELADTLARDDMRQVNQRITARYHLDPLSQNEAKAYILHRLMVGGIAQDIFHPDAMAEVCLLANGIPRLINSICERCLLGAYALGKKHINKMLVHAAAAEVLGINNRQRQKTTSLTPLITAASLVVIVFFLIIDPMNTGLLSKTANLAMFTHISKALGLKPQHKTPKPKPEPVSQADPEPVPVLTPTPVPVPEPVPVPKSAPVPTPKAKITISDIWQNPDISGYIKAALTKLFALWGYEYSVIGGGDICQDAKKIGLQCHKWHGTWAAIENVNRPTLINLTSDSDNGKHIYAVVTALDGDNITININGNEIKTKTSKVSSLWSGEYLLLWKPSDVFKRNMTLGMNGKDVAWLRKKLSNIQGKQIAAKKPENFDNNLKNSVIAFQKSLQIKADGVVGTLTMIHINTLAKNPDIPILHDLK